VRDESYRLNGAYVTVKKIEIIGNQIFCDVIGDDGSIRRASWNELN